MNRIATYYRAIWHPQTTVRFAIVARLREVYVFAWDDDPASAVGVLRAAGRYASDPDLSFTWYEAAKLSQTVREAIQ